MSITTPHSCIEEFVPEELAALADPQTDNSGRRYNSAPGTGPCGGDEEDAGDLRFRI
jgi:hypothetical protein